MLHKIAVIAVAASVASTGCDSTSSASTPVEPAATTVDTVAASVDDDSDADSQALNAVRDELDGYGSWSDDDDYGNVWTPNEVAFIPYVTDGRWVTVGTKDPIWLANSTWGAVTTHHGRWVATPSVGVAGASSVPRWRWVPGVTLQNSWASWHAVDRIAATTTPTPTTATPTTPTIWRSEVAEKLGTPMALPVVETAKVAEVTVPTHVPTEVAVEARVAQSTKHEDVAQPTETTPRVERVDGSAAGGTLRTPNVEDAPRDLRMAWNGPHVTTNESSHVTEGGHFARGGTSTSSGHASSGGHGGRGR